MLNNLMNDLRSHYRITADKRLRYASPKFACRRISFIRKTLTEILDCDSWQSQKEEL